MTLYLDLSSLARWTGPAVGIARVEHALGQAAVSRPDTVRVLWDASTSTYRCLRPDWAETILGWRGALDIPDPSRSILSRHALFTVLERARLTRRSLAPIARRLQDALLAIRSHGHRLRDAAGHRIAHLPSDMVFAESITPKPRDTIFSAGGRWSESHATSIADTKRRYSVRYTCLCYDLIPMTHPQFYFPHDVELFTRHWRAILPIADRIICNSACIAADIARCCAADAIAVPETVVLPLGYDPPPPAAAHIPAQLRPGHFILFVSTIEPRKGHAMLLRVWRRLLSAGVPQAHDVHLVFVGRKGWMVDDVLADLRVGIDRVHHLQNVDDPTLAALYAHAAFVVYPSQYEGFGLPVIEAFARGKPVLAATGGALPETVAGAFPCLDPDDEAAWQTTIAAWIEVPPAPATTTQPANWSSAAARILTEAARR